MQVLVTGRAGYIDTHTVLTLLENGYGVIAYDNSCNSSTESLERAEILTAKTVKFIEGDIRNKYKLTEVSENNDISIVIHFGTLKELGELTSIPLSYVQSNLHNAVYVLEVTKEFGVNDFIFSPSTSELGEENDVPYSEDMKLGTPSSPYGANKVMVERILLNLVISDPQFRAVSLRHFNSIGAD